MQHHHSLVSRSLQPSIDSLPSISDLSLNLISFLPTPPPPLQPRLPGGTAMGRWTHMVFEWLHVYGVLSVCVVWPCVCGVLDFQGERRLIRFLINFLLLVMLFRATSLWVSPLHGSVFNLSSVVTKLPPQTLPLNVEADLLRLITAVG